MDHILPHYQPQQHELALVPSLVSLVGGDLPRAFQVEDQLRKNLLEMGCPGWIPDFIGFPDVDRQLARISELDLDPTDRL